MDLDLITNSTSIKKSVNSFLTSKISWLVLGYIGNKTLAVIETGDDSLEDMFEEFHGSKVMYGFASVVDPNSKLKKNVFIFWQGSGASQSIKTASVQHCTVIRELCKPIHVTITARDEQDLDLKEIMLKVSAASGSNYSFHNEDKHIYETQPSIKSEGNTANMSRQERQKELASLGNIKRGEVLPTPKVSTNGTKNEPVKSLKPVVNSQPTYQKPNSNYVKINPEKELQSLNANQKTTFESAARVQSENNTAERAREERQKELSQLMNRTFTDDGYQQVGTNYTKINPIAEIQKLRKQSQSHDIESVQNSTNANICKFDAKNEITRLRRESNTSEIQENFNPPPVASSYKKIDPLSEIQQLRKSNQLSESDTCVSPSSNYKKINPAEEIKSLKSQNAFSFQDTTTATSSYKKVNPMEEIMAARRSSKSSTQIIEETKPIQRTTSTNDNITARMSFENIHKKEDSHKRTSYVHKAVSPNVVQTVKMPVVETKSEEKVENPYNSRKNANTVDDRIETTKTPVEKKTEDKSVNQFNFQTKISQEKIHPIEIGPPSPAVSNSVKPANSAVAIYEYQANDSDEISFDVDDLITGIEQIDDGWWIGCNKEGIKGMFPSNYVTLCKNTDERVSNDADASNCATTDTAATNTGDAPIASSDSRDESRELSGSTDLPLTVIAQFAYSAQDGDEISFEEGDKIFNVNKIDDGWWEGETRDGARGMFPSNYVMIL